MCKMENSTCVASVGMSVMCSMERMRRYLYHQWDMTSNGTVSATAVGLKCDMASIFILTGTAVDLKFGMTSTGTVQVLQIT